MFWSAVTHYKPGGPTMPSGYFARAADADPTYKLPQRFRSGVLVYLGRAYLETGRDIEARKTLERAVALDKNDPLAHLYFGIALSKTGECERGRKEIEGGLKAIDDTLEYIAEDRVYGLFWGPRHANSQRYPKVFSRQAR